MRRPVPASAAEGEEAGWRIEIPDQPTAGDREAVVAPLADFNARNGYPVDSRPVAVLLKDGSGATVGGLWGKTSYG